MNDNTDSILSIILEKINYAIDENVKKQLQSQKVRKEMAKKYGNSAFLDSKDLKFPVINPLTGQYDCKLIYACILRSAVHSSKGGSSKNPKKYYDDIKEKAVSLYNSHQCSEKLKVKLSKESSEEVDLLVINSIFNITEQEMDELLINTTFVN